MLFYEGELYYEAIDDYGIDFGRKCQPISHYTWSSLCFDFNTVRNWGASVMREGENGETIIDWISVKPIPFNDSFIGRGK